MVGRNEPCPCRSGKKYKACCLKKESTVVVAASVKNELKDCIDRFADKNYSLQEIRKMEQWKATQSVKLKKLFSPKEIDFICGEAYSFMYQLEAWQQHLNNEIRKAIRPAVKNLLEMWSKPKYMLLHIEEEQEHYYVAKDILTDQMVEIENDNILRVNVGEFIFGPFLNSSLENPNSYFSINVMVIPPRLEGNNKIWSIKSAYVKGQWQSTESFYLDNLIDCYKMLGEKGRSEDNLLSEKELTLLQALEKELIIMDLSFTEITEVVTKYLQLEGYPKRMQKQQGFIAGAIFTGEALAFYEFNYPRKLVADYLGISVATANKYEKLLLSFYDAYGEEFRKPAMAFVQGTDPRPSEYGQWKVMMHMKDVPIDNLSNEELNAEIMKLQNKPYMPKTDEEFAQVYAYESYLSSSAFEKVNLANKAWDLNVQNPDALLLRAAFVKDLQEQREYMEQAIRLGEQQLDDSIENPWAYVLNRPYMRALFAYGVSYFEEGQYDEALKPFEKLLTINPTDNQGVRFLAIACYLSLGKLAKAEQLLKKYHDESDSMTMWLKWAWLKKKGEATAKVEKALEQAAELNRYVEQYMLIKASPISYPKSLTMKRQSPEEGKMTWYLLYPLV